jgi:transcriptional regulator with PAS, ATPase and Fis domain
MDNRKLNPSQRNDNNKIRNESLLFLAAERSKVFQNILDIARRVARFDSSVLIRGETGVGKEVVARYIHAASPRSENSLLTINCGALPETLLDSELFGHKAGSFTGAIRDRVGLFEQAARGTILLDEIGDISLATQVKLLRVLQEREILRIGENIPRKVDTRIIAATNRNLEQAVSEKKFREDLLYRLRVIEIEVPPLRERPEDIISLAEYCVKKLLKRLNLPGLQIDPDCLDYFQTYTWPGNVRELQNAIERAAVLSIDGKIRPEHLPPQILNPDSNHQYFDMSKPKSLKEVELNYIGIVLKATGGNKARAAKILGIGQATLWRKLKNIKNY